MADEDLLRYKTIGFLSLVASSISEWKQQLAEDDSLRLTSSENMMMLMSLSSLCHVVNEAKERLVAESNKE